MKRHLASLATGRASGRAVAAARACWRGRWPLVGVLMLAISSLLASPEPSLAAESRSDQTSFNYPSIPPGYPYLRRLLDNAFQYANPAHGLVDPHSGYPVEGWNQAPEQGLFLRSFTQLTAIGAWVELLANIVAGEADNPFISKESALNGLALAVASLLADQANPELAARGLLVNFLGLEGESRQGPLQESIEKQNFIAAVGDSDGPAIWQALIAKGWLQEANQGRQGRIRRSATFGSDHFDGLLAPYAEASLKAKIMALLDRRAVTIIFGDNANLTAALARATGALLHPAIRHESKVTALRAQIERFIAGQQAGYAHLFDPETGTFFFGWDATAERFVGWDDGRGNWIAGRMNYFINEFRGPWTFVVLRYALPLAALRNAGFKMKPYRRDNGRDTYALAAWDGSAFQLLGLSLFMQETWNPGWRLSLATLAELELAHARRHRLPGLLSEAYSGRGTEYTGLIGIPELAVTDQPLIAHAPSLYTLGVAATLAPAAVDDLLREHWSDISRLFTDHGPWEGWDTVADQAIPYQTTAHTLSLMLGGIHSAQDNMRRYLTEHRLLDALHAIYAPGDSVNFLDAGNTLVGWSADRERLNVTRTSEGCRLTAALRAGGGLTFSLPEQRTVSLSNGRLRLRYRSATELRHVSISFARAPDDPLPSPTIPIELLTRFRQTASDEIDIVLPATPALWGIHSLSLTVRPDAPAMPVDISIAAFDFLPFDAALDTLP